MIPPNTLLYVYDFRGDPGDHISNPPASFIGLWNEERFCYFFAKPEHEQVKDEVSASLALSHCAVQDSENFYFEATKGGVDQKARETTCFRRQE